jgi:hypothetical protein
VRPITVSHPNPPQVLTLVVSPSAADPRGTTGPFEVEIPPGCYTCCYIPAYENDGS